MGGNFIGATGLDENQEQFDTLNDKIDANADYINNLVGIPDPTHTAIFGINILNPGLFGLVERAEVNIASLQTAEEGLGTDLSALTTQVETIETQITTIQGELTTIQGEITGIEGEISLIQFTELPAIVSSISAVGAVAGDALIKSNKSLGIWDEDGNNTYNMKSGNVAIGILPKGTLLNNKLEVNGSINIPTGSSFKINNVPFSYSDIAGTPPVSSKWTNATDVATNIYYSTGNVGIGVTTAINNKLEVNGSINIPTGSKYKINNIDLSYNDLTNKLTGGTNISIVSGAINNTLTAGTNISIVSGAINNTLTAGTNISIVSGAINNTYTYTLPTAGVGTGGTLGGVKVDNSTITITNGVISAAAATPQVNSDWTQTNTSLKSFIQNKPTAGNNISFANNTITNTITGSTSQNIIGLNANQLIIIDKPNSEKLDEAFVPLTNEPVLTQNVIVSDAYYPRVPSTNSATWTDNGYTINVKVSDAVLGTQYIYYIFNHIITSQDHYHSQASYTGTGNTYAGATRFKTFAGIAIGVDYGRSIYPERMRIAPRPLQSGFTGNDFINGAPKAFKIFASDDAACWNDNNHSSWTLIHDQTTGLTYTNEQYTIVNLTSNLPKYRYYTMVVLSTIGNYAGGYMMIAEWNMGGDEKIVAIPEGTPTITHKTLNFAYTPQYPIVDVNNLLVHYKFDDFGSGEGYLDSSGNGYNLTARAGDTPVFSYNNSIVGSSAYENGSTGSGLVIPNTLGSLISSTNTTTGISISFWFSLALASNWADVLCFGFNNADYRGLIIGQPPSQNRFFIGMQNGTTFPYGYIGNANGGMFNSLWHHLVWTIDTQGNWKVYIDNILQTFGDVNQGTNGVPKYTIPNYAYNNNTFFAGFQASHNNGYIDDFRMYKKVLSVAEISTLYNISSVPRTFTLSVPLSGTGVIINNTPLQYLSAGTYTISVGATQSSVVISGIGQVGSDPYPLTNGSTIAFKYSMTQRTQATTYYKKDGLIKYVPASGTNPSTGTWQMFDVDSQALTQFGGNLPFTRIDGNVPLTRIEGNISGKIPISSTDGNLPASRIDNLALSLGMDLTGVNGATQIKLTSGIVVVEGNLYSTGVNYFKYNVWHLDSDGFQRFYFQQSNTTYLKGHGTTPFEFRNGANTNICNISGGGGLSMASYLQGSGAGGGFRLVRPDTWVRMKSTDETIHLNFAAQNLYAHGTLDAQGIINLNNFTYVRMQSIANTGNELVCVIGNDAQGEYYNKVLYIAYGTFTGFHRCYVEDELCNDENIDIFKNEYIGRVVISTGKIKTDASRKKEGEEEEHEWFSLEGKEGITIEDALPIIQLSRVRKDKRVYGVLGDPKRGTNNNSRIIVNGCGEGAICVANTNGNIENGDYIQTSDLLGYGEKQDDDLHRNYTIAKAVMDCTFELDNPNYECKELASGVRVAMIACVYKAS